MKRRIPFAVVFVMALALVSLLPLYVERTMTHVMFADGSGGAIHWGWKRCTLRSFCSAFSLREKEF